MNPLTLLSYPGNGQNLNAEPAPNLALDYNPYFFKFMGQSNAAGVGARADATSGTNIDRPKVTMWDNVLRKWNMFQPGVNTRGVNGVSGSGAADPHGISVAGAELMLMKRIEDDFPDYQKYLFKYCISNSPLGTSASYLEWRAAAAGELYYRMTTTYTQAMRGMRNIKPPRFVIWMQGENDGQDGTMTSAYETNLTAFITAYRSFIGYQIPFIITGISNNQTAVTNRASIKTAQQAVVAAMDDCYFVDMDGQDVQVDNVHFEMAALEYAANYIYDNILVPNDYLPPA